MPEVAWLLFVVASIVLIVTPGQDITLVMSRSLARGRPPASSPFEGPVTARPDAVDPSSPGDLP